MISLSLTLDLSLSLSFHSFPSLLHTGPPESHVRDGHDVQPRARHWDGRPSRCPMVQESGRQWDGPRAVQVLDSHSNTTSRTGIGGHQWHYRFTQEYYMCLLFESCGFPLIPCLPQADVFPPLEISLFCDFYVIRSLSIGFVSPASTFCPSLSICAFLPIHAPSLSLCYRRGVGLPRSDEWADVWFKKANDQVRTEDECIRPVPENVLNSNFFARLRSSLSYKLKT